MMADWMPLQERGGAQGLLWMSSRVGGAAAPSLLVWLIAVMGNWQGYDLRLMSWGDGSGVPTSGNNLVIVGIDNNSLLRIRIFDADGNRVKDTDETKLPNTQAGAISSLKQQLPGLLHPHVLTDGEKARVIAQATSIVGQTHWQAPVLLAACLGAVWCALFWPWFRNRPEEMRQVNQAELKIIASGRAAKADDSHGKIPWSAMFQSRSVVALCAMYGFLGYSGNFFLTLLPTYLKNHRHLSSETAGLLTSMPFACGTVACLMGGAMSDLIIRRWGPRWGRRTVGAVGMSLAALCILCTAWADTVPLLGILLCLTFIGNDLAMGPAWAAATDIGGRHTGVLSGAMNMMASLTAALGALATGYLFESGQMVLPFAIFSGSYALGAMSWLGVDVRRTLEGVD
jgi:sugar phosphate permease